VPALHDVSRGTACSSRPSSPVRSPRAIILVAGGSASFTSVTSPFSSTPVERDPLRVRLRGVDLLHDVTQTESHPPGGRLGSRIRRERSQNRAPKPTHKTNKAKGKGKGKGKIKGLLRVPRN
jgi:hypothetical protein